MCTDGLHSSAHVHALQHAQSERRKDPAAERLEALFLIVSIISMKSFFKASVKGSFTSGVILDLL